MNDKSMNAGERAVRAGWLDTGFVLSPLGEGHIHETLLVTEAGGRRYVLQRINQAVFTDPGRVMTNMERVLAHFDALRAGLTARLIPTRDGQAALVDGEGEWWRLWGYVEDSRTLSRTSDPEVCTAAGEAFGRFQRLLASLPGPPPAPVIPGFLELDGYLQALDAELERHHDADGILADACGSVRIFRQYRHLGDCLPPRGDLIHGDCKLNNLLFATGSARVLAVLDLDTVMAGHSAWDFGDLVRSVLMGSSGDGEMIRSFAVLSEGFARGSGADPDPDALLEAPVYVSYMLGVRFLTDHLQGDRYFRVEKTGDNLYRAREQFELLSRLERRRDDFRRVLEAALLRTALT